MGAILVDVDTDTKCLLLLVDFIRATDFIKRCGDPGVGLMRGVLVGCGWLVSLRIFHSAKMIVRPVGHPLGEQIDDGCQLTSL
jgi:hypothetical protein